MVCRQRASNVIAQNYLYETESYTRKKRTVSFGEWIRIMNTSWLWV